MTTTTPSLSVDETEDALVFRSGDQELTRYVFAPQDPTYESPRPYFHPIRTLEGDLVSIYRPWDHVWHKGLSWSLPNVGPHNFWGGATYTRATGYADLDNNGAMRHRAFAESTAYERSADVVETLDWTAQSGAPVVTEERAFRIALPDAAASGWSLLFETTMTNAGDSVLEFGSPTTEGRDNAGYGGLFWRGPRSFSGGEVSLPGGTGRDDPMGSRSPWIAFTGRHDETSRRSTITFAEDPGNLGAPNQWFTRTESFGCVGSAPFFSEVVPLAPGESLRYRYGVSIADGDPAATEGDALLEELASWRR